MSQSLVDLMKSYYDDIQETLPYRLVIHLHIEGYNSGTYDTDAYTDIDFTDVK
jgi:fatty acid-binding protein DegV